MVISIVRQRVPESATQCPFCRSKVLRRNQLVCCNCRKSFVDEKVKDNIPDNFTETHLRILCTFSREMTDENTVPSNYSYNIENPLTDFNVDSLQEVQLIIAIEEEFGIFSIPDEIIEALPHFDDPEKTLKNYICAIADIIATLPADQNQSVPERAQITIAVID